MGSCHRPNNLPGPALWADHDGTLWLRDRVSVQVGKLQEVDRDLITKAIAVLKHLLTGMDRQSASRAAVQVAEQLLPLFDDVSSKLQVLSITLFKDLLELVRGPNRRQMKEHVLQSLIPLLLLVHDERPNVSQTSKACSRTASPQSDAWLLRPSSSWRPSRSSLQPAAAYGHLSIG
ncbi:maestro heat-like repeat-containing protein family member 7 [Mauremys mutica]|uniref:maestro heat-like repeat-containing protein family member 7 n=1 Tax=Mauremys mutica TaxID=74926 RepID=UPI001D1670DE|nr:maestro heat-like repeat-containing protein family member 7 [Mauremys mutica]